MRPWEKGSGVTLMWLKAGMWICLLLWCVIKGGNLIFCASVPLPEKEIFLYLSHRTAWRTEYLNRWKAFWTMPGTGFVMCMLAITVLYYSGDPEKTELQETPLPINAISTKDFKVLVSLWFLSRMSLKIPRKIKQSPPSYLWYRHNGLLFLCFPNHFSFRRWHDFVVKSSSLWVLPKQFGCPSLPKYSKNRQDYRILT